ncbi:MULTISPECIES: TIGR04211 family SH3 domain-containing protein [unclassified Vibrio]|uniref:TIGR04211 family SH3 domain-containing protein n=1 Tax=Vibrio sp. HB236076 TaxID=3232307 RepID=A0AB39HH44_9VIBR|nr:TIGR04211 family SH3 domain-containing protein [Vibrio sp. HB161653]MDP5254510.1 TIGR04211 family SH3 domain-containing protein [Vibrio sp. HB161653]
MKKLIGMILLSMLAIPAALAQDYYISDDLFTYMHSGPTNNYRIIGSVNAGEKVQLISSNKETGFTQIVDGKGRKGWVQSKFISGNESIAIRLPRVEKELEKVKSQLANARKNADVEKAGLVESLDTRNQQISELETKFNEINQQLIAAQSDNRQLRARLDTQKDDLLLKYFTYGGGVAGGGLLLGLILPHLIPRRKKSPSGWA